MHEFELFAEMLLLSTQFSISQSSLVLYTQSLLHQGVSSGRVLHLGLLEAVTTLLEVAINIVVIHGERLTASASRIVSELVYYTDGATKDDCTQIAAGGFELCSSD